MAIKKSELYSTLWQSCDELRGGMDASQYKDYVLVLLFMKYVSDKAASNANYLLDVPPDARFAEMVALKGKANIGEEINKIISRLAEANDLKGVIDVADFNDPEKLGRGQEMVDRLSNLIAIFDKPELDFRGNRAEGDDLLGDAYEYLMRHFATESGKSKGQFYTPAEVSRIMARVLGVRTAREGTQTIYDPTCGSGSLLLKAHDEAQAATGLDLAIYGQEMDVATTALAKMNMILHDAETADIAPGGYSTLANPQFTNPDGSLKTFDFVVANPPFSNKAWRNGLRPEEDMYGRFSTPWTVPPAKNGDYAFLLHIVASLKSTGKAAVILPHGVLFRPNSEAFIRREIVRRGYIKGIVGMPPNLFYGTGIPACIVVLDKAEAATRKGIFMIDASRGFMKDGAKNRLRAQDIHRIVDIFARQAEEPRYSRLVPTEEIERNDFTLNIPRYIDSSDPEDRQDLRAHLQGGIPGRDIDALDVYWRAFTTLRNELFEGAGRPGYLRLCTSADQAAKTILQHPEVAAFTESVDECFAAWRAEMRPLLAALDSGSRPSPLIGTISEGLLAAFRRLPLVDPYGAYQILMDYWANVMQDDCYLVAELGWSAAAQPRRLVERKGEPKQTPDFTDGGARYKSDLLPAEVLIDARFAGARDDLVAIEGEIAALDEQLEQLLDEHGGEGGALEQALDERGKLSKKSLDARLKEIEGLWQGYEADADERRLLGEAADLLERQSGAKARLKAAEASLNSRVAAGYRGMDADAVRDLVIDHKWLVAVESQIKALGNAAVRALAARVNQLAGRYAQPLPDVEAEIAGLDQLVRRHLEELGAWRS